MTALAVVAVVVAVVALILLFQGRRAHSSQLDALRRELGSARREVGPDAAATADGEIDVGARAVAAPDGPDGPGAVEPDRVAGDADAAPPEPGEAGADAAPPEPGEAGADALGPEAPEGSVEASGVLSALWSLTALDQVRSRRAAAALSTAPPSQAAAGGLAAGLEDEVGRLREETGTPGALRVALDAEAAPGDAELLLRSVQSLLSVLCRHCQGYDLYVHRFEQRLMAVVVCEGFDGPDSVGEEIAEVLAALQPVDGRIELDRDPQGRLRARLSIPAALSSGSGPRAPGPVTPEDVAVTGRS